MVIIVPHDPLTIVKKMQSKNVQPYHNTLKRPVKGTVQAKEGEA